MAEPMRELFALPDGLHYLNCAYMSPLARAVEAAGIEGMRRKRDPSRIGPAAFFAESDEARRLFARLIGAADPARIAIVPAVSYGIATVARNTRAERGQNVVVAHEQFPSNVYAWRRLCAERGLELRTVAPPADGGGTRGARRGSGARGGGSGENGRGEAWNARLLDAVDAATAVVALPHVHWTDGTRFDLPAIAARAREVGAALVVDGTQSIGALPFDLAEIPADAVICAGYKWLLGPYGIGLAYYGPRYDDGEPLEETWIARQGSEDFRRLVDYQDAYQPGAARYDVGERSNFILVPMLVAALRLVLEQDPTRIQEHCRTLAAPLVAEARALGFGVEDDAWRAAHLFGLRNPPGLTRERLGRELERRNVAVALRGSAVRVSPHVYNGPEDLAALADALRAAVG